MNVSINIESIPADLLADYRAAAVREEDNKLWLDNQSEAYRSLMRRVKRPSLASMGKPDQPIPRITIRVGERKRCNCSRAKRRIEMK